MEFNTTYELEKFIIDTRWDDFPDNIKQRAKMNFLDLLGALILGAKGKQFQSGMNVAKQSGMKGKIPVIGSSEKFNLLGATICMGHASNSFDIDDGYNMIKGHPGTSFIGGVLAAALENKVPYTEFLTTLIVSYETTIRWALSEQNYYNFMHSTGTYGAFGTAAGVGRLKKLSKEQLNNALSIADYHAPLVPVARAVEYPSNNKDGTPFGALIGTISVLETIAGETGVTHLLEMPKYREYIESLGKKYYCLDLYYKPFTCCRWTHQPISACIDLMKTYSFTYQELKKVTVHTFAAAAQLTKKIPNDTEEAQYNISFPVASSLVFGDVGYKQINDDAVHNKDVHDVMGLLSFVVDPEMERRFPEERLAWVEISLKDGRQLKSGVYSAPGEHTDPNLNLNWIIEKFTRITSPIIDSSVQLEIVKKVVESDDCDLTKLINYINKHILKG